MFAAMKRSLVGILVALFLPGSALAATTKVDAASGGACSRGGTCKGISQAISVSQAGDTLAVKKATYVEDPVSGVAGLTIDAEPGTALSGTLTLNAPATIRRLAIFATSGASALTAAQGVDLADAAVVTASGSAVTIIGGTSRIQRSTLYSAEPGSAASDGLKLGAATVTVDSSIVVGGAKGAAYRVTPTGGSANAALTLNHVTTIAGPSAKAIVLDGTGGSLPVGKVGDIALTVNSSIVHGASSAASDPGVIVVRAPNSVTTSVVKSDMTAFNGADGQPVAGTGTVTPEGDVFAADKPLRQKFGSPLIDKGAAALAPGESATDIDGDPRVADAASDIGADEFVDHAPSLTLSVAPGTVRTNEVVAAYGRATDRDGNSDITSYATKWGDGTATDVTTIGAVAHTYANPGTYTVSMVAIDKSGTFSDPATQTVTVKDSDPPALRVNTPRANALVTLNSRKGHKALLIKGAAIDPGGVASVEVALTRVVGRTCLQYAGAAFARGKCTGYVFRKAISTGDTWRLQTDAGVAIPKGTYEIRARATDAAGNQTAGFDAGKRTLVRFRVK